MSRYWDDELYHHGIKGQSWGVENGPPYPLNAAGKRKFRERLKARMKQGTEAAKRKIAEASRVHKENKAARKAAKIEEKEAERAAKRQKTLDTLAKSPTALYKNRDAYTTEELKKALDRINTEQKLHEMSVKELSRGKDILDTVVGYGQTAVKAYSTGEQLIKDVNKLRGKDIDNSNSENSKSDNSDSSKKTDTGNAKGVIGQLRNEENRDRMKDLASRAKKTIGDAYQDQKVANRLMRGEDPMGWGTRAPKKRYKHSR